MVRFTAESNFRDLNKACSKNDLPSVTLTYGSMPLCSFNVLITDGLSGYTQIKMIPYDVEKTTLGLTWTISVTYHAIGKIMLG